MLFISAEIELYVIRIYDYFILNFEHLINTRKKPNHHLNDQYSEKMSWIFVMSCLDFIVYSHYKVQTIATHETVNQYEICIRFCMCVYLFSFVWMFSRLICFFRLNHMTRIAATKPFKYVVLFFLKITANSSVSKHSNHWVPLRIQNPFRLEIMTWRKNLATSINESLNRIIVLFYFYETNFSKQTVCLLSSLFSKDMPCLFPRIDGKKRIFFITFNMCSFFEWICFGSRSTRWFIQMQPDIFMALRCENLNGFKSI